MGVRAGDVLGGELAVEVDGGVDLLHDLGRAGGETPAPHGVAHGYKAPGSNDEMRTTARTASMAAVRAAPSRWPPWRRSRSYTGKRRRRQGRGRLPRRLGGAAAPRLAPLAHGDIAALAVDKAPKPAPPIAFEGPGGAQAEARRFSRQARCSSISGRPGACPAAPKCRRSTGCKQRPARQGFPGGGGQRRHRAARSPRRLPRSDRRQGADPLRRPERRFLRDACASPARRSACRPR